MKDYYYDLNITNQASIPEIKKAYFICAKLYHPDRINGDEERFKKCLEAYDFLIDPIKKEEYDRIHNPIVIPIPIIKPQVKRTVAKKQYWPQYYDGEDNECIDCGKNCKKYKRCYNCNEAYKYQ